MCSKPPPTVEGSAAKTTNPQPPLKGATAITINPQPPLKGEGDREAVEGLPRTDYGRNPSVSGFAAASSPFRGAQLVKKVPPL